MKKTFKSRLLSSLTAVSLALTTFGGALVQPIVGNAGKDSVDAPSAGNVFSYTPQYSVGWWSGDYFNNLYSRLVFKQADDSNGSAFALPDDTYYVLVHAVTEKGENTYKALPLENPKAEGGDIISSTPKFNDVLQPDSATNQFPSGKSIEGTLVKNNGTTPLTVNYATGTGDYTIVNTIGNYSLTAAATAPTLNGNTFVTDVISGQRVNVKFFDSEGDSTTKPLSNSKAYNHYYVLGTVKEGTAIAGWAIKEIFPEDGAYNGDIDVGFNTFIPYAEEGKSTSGTLEYDPSKYTFDARVYCCDEEITNYKDCKAKASDSIIDYKPSKNIVASGVDITFVKNVITYTAKVNFIDGNGTFDEEDGYYIVLDVEHGSTGMNYFAAPIVVNDESSKLFSIQQQVTSNWYDNDGNVPNNQDRFHGNETVTGYIVKADSLTGAIKRDVNNSSVFNDGQFVKNFKIEVVGQTAERGDGFSNFTYTINLRSTEASELYTYKQILGGIAVNFGITADRLEQEGHMQTNFAANKYKTAEFRPDLSDPDGGSVYVGQLVTFDADDKTKTTEVDPPYIHFENINIRTAHDPGYGCDLYTPYGDTVDITADGLEYVNRHTMSAEDINNKVLTPAFSHVANMSDTLASLPVTVTPIKESDKYHIDGSAYPENVTLVVDGDELLNGGYMLDNFKITLREGQNVVFNFTSSDKVQVDKYSIRTLKDDGTYVPVSWNANAETGEFIEVPDPGEGQVYRSDRNKWYNKYVMRNVIFNFNSPTDIQMGNNAGVFIVKNPNSITKMEGTTTGWVVTPGYFRKGSGEWHFPYDELEDIDLDDNANITVSKTAINGQAELPGATLTITDETRPQSDWDYMISKNTGVTAVKDDEGNTIGMTWTSGTTARKLVLLDGKYTLKESGTEPFVSGGRSYDVISSTIEFEISGKQLVTADQTVYENGTDDTEGSIVYSKENKKITISDAELKSTVTISKKAINGADELPGATLVITDDGTKTASEWAKIADENGVAVTSNGKGITWTSGTDAKDIVLPDGKYTLTESGDVVSANGKSYAVVTSSIGFNVEKGDVVGRDTTIVNEPNGEIKLDVDNDTITISDAEMTADVSVSKKAAGGESELPGATLFLYDTEDKITDAEWARIASTVEGASVVTKDGHKGITWTSTNAAQSFKLPDGKYALKETGTTVEFGGKTYYVVNSTLEFDVKAGKVTASTKTVRDGDHGTMEINTDNGKITISDAEAKETVKISKKAVNGESELPGATLIITDKDGSTTLAEWQAIADKVNGVTVTSDGKGITWVSGTAPKEIELGDGTYILKETSTNGETFVSGGKTYSVVQSELEFKIKGGKVDTNSTSVTDNDGSSIAIDKDTATITVSDAERQAAVKISKIAVGGTAELDGATLILKNDKISTAEWTKIAAALGGRVSVTSDGKGVTWTSGTEPVEFMLSDGDYTLEETGTTVEYNGRTFAVVNSTISFTVEGGVVTTADQTIDDANGSINIKSEGNSTKITISDAEITKTVTVSKKAVAGSEELPGAKLVIKDATKTNVDWIRIANENGGKVQVTDTNDGIYWISGSAPVDITLPDGKYTLSESGNTFTSGGKTYNVVDSTIDFEIKAGVLTPGTVPAATEKGSITVDGDKFTINDAEVTTAEQTVTVKISKKAVGGQSELPGATLFITDNGTKTADQWAAIAAANGVTVTTVEGKTGITWQSGDSAKEITLGDGTYVLKETGDKVVVGDKTYEVVESSTTFTIKDGAITSNPTEVTEDNGTITYDESTKTITICDAERQTTEQTVTVKISKKAVGGQSELPGATLFITDNGTKTADQWAAIAAANGVTVTTVEGKTGITWTSGDSAKEITLGDGTYVLKETGDKVVVGDKTYEVVESSTTFTIKDGAITSNPTEVTEDNGTITYDESTKTITICDAERQTAEQTVTVKISKKAVGGQSELPGATLFITDNGTKTGDQWAAIAAANGVTVTTVEGKTGITWTSGDSAKEITLGDGTYVLKETGDKVVVGDKTYEVVESSTTFTIKDGAITSNPTEVTEDNGTITYDESTKTITICDAERQTTEQTVTVKISKKAVGGQSELPGATLFITDNGTKTGDQWAAIAAANGVTVTTVEGKTGITWISGDAAKEITLGDGTYVLKETGDKVVVGDKTYEVVESSTTFTIKDGAITSDPTEVTEDNGTITYDESTKTITICDAERQTAEQTVTVKISKKAVGGQSELPGATLFITDNGTKTADQWAAIAAANGVTVTTVEGKTGITWISGDAAKEITLGDGTYVLKETGDKVVVGDKTYEVVESSTTFTIKDGAITSNPTEVTEDNGTITYDESTKTITICDAERTETGNESTTGNDSNSGTDIDNSSQTGDESRSGNDSNSGTDQPNSSTPDDSMNGDNSNSGTDQPNSSTADDSNSGSDSDANSNDSGSSSSSSSSSNSSNGGGNSSNGGGGNSSNGGGNNSNGGGDNNPATGLGKAAVPVIAIAALAVLVVRKKNEDDDA